MSQNHYRNGDKVVSECVFCGGQFEEPQKLGETIHCNEEAGGCGNKFRISIVPSILKDKEE